VNKLLLLLLILPALAQAASVESCDRSGMVGKNRSACGGYLSLTTVANVQPGHQILSCPTNPPPATISGCTAAVWKLRSNLAPTDWISYCAKAPTPGWGACGGSESWKQTSTVFGGGTVPNPPPPPTSSENVVMWTYPLTCTDGSPVSNCPTTGYRLSSDNC